MTNDAQNSHDFTDGLYGHITHTDLASDNPEATRQWCAAVLGWSFQPPMTTPDGDYHVFTYSEAGGGGVRATAAGEATGATPTVHVSDTDAAHASAVAAGAESLQQPTRIMAGVKVARVRAPGGVVIGFSGPTD